MEVDTYALNSLGCIGAAYGCSVMSSGWRKRLVCLASLMSCDTTKLSVDDNIYIYIYIYMYMHVNV